MTVSTVTPLNWASGVEQEPMAQHRLGELLDVVGQHVVAAVGRGPGLGGADQGQAAARATARADVGAGGATPRRAGDVVEHRRVGVHGGGQAGSSGRRRRGDERVDRGAAVADAASARSSTVDVVVGVADEVFIRKRSSWASGRR